MVRLLPSLPKRILFGVVISFVLAIASGSRADDEPYVDEKRAEQLFGEGLKLMDEGRYAEACEKLAACMLEDPTLPTRYNLAVCYERAKRFRDAIDEYERTADLAKEVGNWRMERDARGLAKALRDRLTTLTILMRVEDAGSPGVKVQLDDEDIYPDGWVNREVLVEGGDHRLTVAAPNRETTRRTVTVPETPIHMQVVAKLGQEMPRAPLLPKEASQPQPLPTPAARSSALSLAETVATLGAVGGGILLVGAVAAIAGAREHEEWRFGAGVAGFVGGVLVEAMSVPILLAANGILAPSKSASSPAPRGLPGKGASAPLFVPLVSPRVAGVSVSFAF